MRVPPSHRRALDSLLPLDRATLVQPVGYLGIGLIVLADCGVLLELGLPGDALRVPVGLRASQGPGNLWMLLLVAALGALLGDAAGYACGKRLGPQFCAREDAWCLSMPPLDRARHCSARHGGKTIVRARFLHLLRPLAPLLAGAAAMPSGTLLCENILGGLCWGIRLAALGYWRGNTVPHLDHELLPILGVLSLLALSPTLIRVLPRRVQQRHTQQ